MFRDIEETMDSNSNTSCVDVAGFDQMFNQADDELLSNANHRSSRQKRQQAPDLEPELGDDNNFEQFITPSKNSNNFQLFIYIHNYLSFSCIGTY